MFWDDIKLVTEQVEKYGLRTPFADLGGMERPCIADYDLTIATGDQGARYVSLNQRPFDHIAPDYLVLNPEQGDPFIEDLPYQYREAFGTVVCLNVLEHVRNPFQVMAALYQVLQKGGLLIVETVFSFPYHPSPEDYWRFSPDCLRHLAAKAGFQVLECDWRLTCTADRGILNGQNGEPQEIRSVYATLTKEGKAAPRAGVSYPLPQRHSSNPLAQEIIDGKVASVPEQVLEQQLRALIRDEQAQELLARHSLLPGERMLKHSLELLGTDIGTLDPVSQEQLNELMLGEYCAHVGHELQHLASQLLYKAQWCYKSPEWFDHRHHFYDPRRFGADFWAMSADLALLKLPLNGKILDLCSGDGYYDYHFYSHRASEVVAVEILPEAYRQALRHHQQRNIRYVNQSIFDFEPEPGYYDVVLIRGAIEHFSAENQQRVFRLADAALKKGGWFCGDTPANPDKGVKQLDSHENEWADEEEMSQVLSQVFRKVDTMTYPSHQRTTLFWQAQKT